MTPNSIANSKQTMTSRWSSLLRYFSSTRGLSLATPFSASSSPTSSCWSYLHTQHLHSADPLTFNLQQCEKDRRFCVPADLGSGFIASWDDDDDSSQALKPPQIALSGIRVLGF
jgi:hypothetical protein